MNIARVAIKMKILINQSWGPYNSYITKSRANNFKIDRICTKISMNKTNTKMDKSYLDSNLIIVFLGNEVAPSPSLGLVAIEKGAFRSP